MRKSSAVLGSLVFFIAAPGTVAGLLPWWISRWRLEEAPQWYVAVRILGGAMIAAGLYVLIDSFLQFALKGLGTPAPPAPPTRLVVSGYYRYVRNPMYVAVLCTVIGQALVFADVALAAYAAIVCAAFMAFVMGYEEPMLKRLFGEQYAIYRANVPPWIPRLRAWNAQDAPS